VFVLFVKCYDPLFLFPRILANLIAAAAYYLRFGAFGDSIHAAPQSPPQGHCSSITDCGDQEAASAFEMPKVSEVLETSNQKTAVSGTCGW